MQRHARGPIAASVFASLRISHVSCFTSRAWHRAIAVLCNPFLFLLLCVLSEYNSFYRSSGVATLGAARPAPPPWRAPGGAAYLRGSLALRPLPSHLVTTVMDSLGRPRAFPPRPSTVRTTPNISSAATRPRRASARRARPTRHRNRNRNAPTSTAAHAHAKSSSPTRSFSTLAPTPDTSGRRRDNTRDMPPRLCRRLQLQLVRITHSTRCT